MDKIKVVAVVVMFILAAFFCLMSFHRTAQFNREMSDLNEHLWQVSRHLDRIATSLEQAQILRPAPAPQQPGR
jgi:Flp pilus assembly protein TadB